jgi:8-oxo-dGTP diphosphatase
MNIWRLIATGLKLVVRHPIFGASLIPILPDGRIVLAQRRDTQQWCLPGGILDWGEDLLSCARRELLEETGFRLVSVVRLVGVYSSLERDPRFHGVTVAIAIMVEATDAGIGDTDEIIAVQAFEVAQIPLDNLSHDHGRILQDYFDGNTVIA